MKNLDVVFIDDEKSLTEIFHHYVLVKYKGWRFTTFTNANNAYEQIVKKRLSAKIWIVDMMMPGKNGSQIAKAIRTSHRSDRPVILAYTALDRQELRQQEEYRSGLPCFDRVVNKRESLPELLSLVDVWLARSQPIRTPLSSGRVISRPVFS